MKGGAIYLKNIATGYLSAVLKSTQSQENPAIDGGIIVWAQKDSINNHLYMLNIATGKIGRLTPNTW